MAMKNQSARTYANKLHAEYWIQQQRYKKRKTRIIKSGNSIVGFIDFMNQSKQSCHFILSNFVLSMPLAVEQTIDFHRKEWHFRVVWWNKSSFTLITGRGTIWWSINWNLLKGMVYEWMDGRSFDELKLCQGNLLRVSRMYDFRLNLTMKIIYFISQNY